MPCLPKLTALYFPPDKRGSATGIAVAGYTVGDIVALCATPFVFGLTKSWRSVFFMYGVWAIALTTAWWMIAKEPSFRPKNLIKAQSVQSNSIKNFMRLLRLRPLWLLAGIYLCAGAVYDTALLWLPSILHSKGISPDISGLVASMLPLAFITGSFLVGILSDKIGSRKSLMLMLGIISGPFIYAAEASSLEAVWFSAFMMGVCTIGVLTLALIVSTELPSTFESAASAVGLISSIGNIGSFIMPIVVGYIRDVTGSFSWAALLLALMGESIFS